ncbi:hypothetical protein EDD22DRAFT_785653 [Suillus occidentalis]|nr:hypothetical protein EDD22DRAFT_785653 [Suillus occidentalis]
MSLYICSFGVIGQWSADVTEHIHIMKVKNPLRFINNNNYDPQICHYLNHADKCNRFDLAISLLDGKLSIKNLEVVREEHEDDDIDKTWMWRLSPWKFHPGLSDLISHVLSQTILQSSKCYSTKVELIPIQLCSFVVGRTALHLVCNPSIRNISVNEVTIMFNLPDLHPTLADFLHHEVTSGHHVYATSGPQRAGPEAELPFNKLQVWFKIHLQEMDFHDAHKIYPA